MKATLIFLLLAQVSWAGPFQQRSIFDFSELLPADEASGAGLDDHTPEDPELIGPVCPFRCQCHLRVVQCSDLGEWSAGSFYPPRLLYSGNGFSGRLALSVLISAFPNVRDSAT